MGLLSASSVGESLRDYVEERVSTGEYPPGAWLPSVRDLATRLSVNRNTVSKVYQGLQREGILRRVAGKGMLVVDVPRRYPRDRSGTGGDLLAQMEVLLRRAYETGLTTPRVYELLAEAATRLRAERHVQVGLAECNREAATSLAAKLATHLRMPVEPLLISEVGPRRWKRGGVLVTTFFHMDEIARIGLASPHLVGIKHEMSYETLRQISELGADQRVALVCPNGRTLERVEQAIRSYTRSALIPIELGRRADLGKALASCDIAIVAWAAQGAVEAIRPDLPLIVVEYEFDAQSVDAVQRSVVDIARSASMEPKARRRTATSDDLPHRASARRRSQTAASVRRSARRT